jgi:hypothetical protein
MVAKQAERPQFYEGQYLGAADLTAVVEHALVGRARHDLGAHTWGIAAGLQLQEVEGAGGQIVLYILPGYAWDAFGRPIVMLAPYTIPAELFKSYPYDPAIDASLPAGRLIEVWLRYEETPTQCPPPGFELCHSDGLFARVQETFRVEVGQRSLADQHDRIAVGGYSLYAQDTLQQFDPLTPPTVLYDESVAFQQLPAAGERKHWLIGLGAVRWLPNAIPGQPGRFVKREPMDLDYSSSLRRYIGVVAGAVQAADKNIRLRDRTKPYSTVQSDEVVWVEGDLRVEGDTRLFGGKLEWRDVNGQDLGVPLDVRRASDTGGNTMLQVAIGAAADGHNRFAVGPLKAGATPADPIVVDEKLVVLDNGNVGIGTTAPTLKLDIRGDFGCDQAGTTLHLSSSLIGDIGDGILFLRSGGSVIAFDAQEDRVGIGTTTPVTKLEIVGDWTGEEGALRLTGDKPALRFTGGATSGDESWLLQVGSNGPGNLEFLTRTGAMAWANIMSLAATGRVGIGTATPRLTLDVQGDFGRDDGPITLNLFGSRVSDLGTGVLSLRSGGGVVAFDGGDNLGINTNTPQEKLDVRGNIKLGANGDLFAMGALQNLKVIAGHVYADGTTDGEGFRLGPPLLPPPGFGSCRILFDPPGFLSPPIVLATPINSAGEPYVVTLWNIGPSYFDVVIMNLNAPGPEIEFTFIALGTPLP